MTSNITNVTVLGTGVLGSQIAFQSAYAGFTVTAYDISDEILEHAKARFAGLAKVYQQQVDGATEARTDAALSRLGVSSDLAAAVADADLVIEAVPEAVAIKRDTYQKLSAAAPAKTIFATNSSTLLPSDIVSATDRPDRFLALHFANEIWLHNTAEVMGTEQTSSEVFDRVVAYAKEMGMVPVPLHKEKSGYVLNSLLVPLLDAALELVVFGYSEPADVDNVWRIGTGAPMGPFQILDVVGLNTPYNIMAHGDERKQQIAAWLKENYLDQGKLGRASGEGFYSYDQAE
ncbi:MULTISPECIES: 3-hydroxyacyl-CoA dehydrogenase [unclassified Pseudoclavibacter]|uniref:3-hydroxyacyl-CoA dehydrogenase n=1 Tax=unclassified Pseudoclavibacter TaxID=2615177 RepID=UPI00130191D8|nr:MULTISPECIES: 3-hydroxyacyl-CoA dehydrogenase [unclassified Pseudoclavibacter]KAB1645597.1 3-hydroxyacyl-CoA dehydrogenase [Pseudoclavibacter sp. CFCC 14310]KAB1645944.1 3-hydroxyacyl-CoA dehydrogenase [Pseudoclavibacter sp. CFCC 14310]KAB1663753.1 3-hydroxyacyl-CoA dehydrogenase [Pseudoclavibacter sp. CFCC 13611]KAB1664498.1 3-hydroxyacyl-CoA dehydrogenase [Pseudoclavibacter sp. CFCC 13611]